MSAVRDTWCGKGLAALVAALAFAVPAYAGSSADLLVTVDDGVTDAVPGGSVTYTIIPFNGGPVAAGNETVTVAFQSPLTCTWSCTGSSGGGSCTGTGSGSGDVSETVSLPVGANVVITASCTVAASATGSLISMAQIQPVTVTDPDLSNNGNSDTDNLTPQADLGIVKDDGTGTVVAGGSTLYTITATNVGPSDAPDATVTDTFPTGTTCDWTCSGAGGGTCTMVGAGDIGESVDLPAGGSVTFLADCDLVLTASGTLDNTAFVAAPAGVADTNTGNDSSNDSDAITAVPDITATKTVSGTFTPGSFVTYTITMTNSGAGTQNDNAGDEFTDVVPSDLTVTFANATSGSVQAAGNFVTWNGGMNPSDVVTITINALVGTNATGTISNQGTIAFDQTADGTNEATRLTDDPGTGAAADPTSFLVSAPQVGGTKTVAGSTAPGGVVTYTVILSNTGTAAAPDATFANEFTDVLPAELQLLSASATSGTATANTGSNTVAWNGAIPASGSVTITITATIAMGATGTVSNQGSIAYDRDGNGSHESFAQTDDPGVGGATDPTVFTILASNVTGTKSVAGTYSPGGTVTYTIVLTNSGNGTQADNSGPEFIDVLPSALTLVSASATSGTATATVGTNTATWNGALVGGASVTITIVATVDADASGSVSNQGTIAVDLDSNGSNEAARVTDDPAAGGAIDATVFTVSTANVTGTKTVAGTFNPNATITYTVTLTNAGNTAQGDNPGNEFTDVLPASLTLVSATATSGTATATIGTNTVTWNGSIAPAGSVTITISATINANATGMVSNQGTIAVDVDVNGTNETSRTTDDPGTGGANDPTTFTVVPLPVPEIAGTKSVAGSFNPGDTVTYTIALTNAGNGAQNDNAGNEFVDVLPAGVTLVSAASTSGTAVATVGTNTVTWNGAIAASGSVTITIAATIDANATGTISNQGSIAYDGDANGTNETTVSTDDPNVGGATDPTSFAVSTSANVTGTKTVAGSFVRGGTVTYTIVLTNTGTGAQGDNAGNEFTDILPAGLTLVSASASAGTAVANVGTSTVTWNGAIAANASVTITITATINNDATGAISNQGTIAYDGDSNGTNEATRSTDDPAAGSGSDATVFSIAGVQAIGGTKTVSGTFAPGGAITYTIVMSNGGGTTQADNPGAEFTDMLPAGLVLTSATATSGTATATVGTRTVTWNGSITAGSSVTITINATIDPTAVGTLTNQGTIAYDADANGTNESTALTDDPGAVGGANGTAFGIVVPAVLVPATDALALLMLAMLVLVVARRFGS